MKVLYSWVKDFADVTAPASEMRTWLSMSGTAVDAIEDTAAGPVLDTEVTINRPDCLGHYGIAREVATLYRLPLKRVHPKLKEVAEKAGSATRVEIEAPDLCARYTARIVRDVKVQPSPDWLRKRLEALGQAAISNVVDVTNYVMFELGKAVHAYDFDKLAEHRIVVRRARPGEKIRTLDGVERTLTKEICVIADGSRAVGIGGVMGGADSEIGVATRDVLIESAWFDPISIRKASKVLGLRTEASLRFERGADLEMVELASQRTAELIQQVAGGEILAGVVDAYPRPEHERKLELTRKELLRIMGADIPDREIEEILGSLGFHPVRVDANRGSSGSLAAAWECRQPTWRRDVSREIDLIEEVARIYGFQKFPARLPPAKIPSAALPHAEAERLLRERIVGLGYQEIVAIPLVDSEQDRLFREEGVTPAAITNPLAEDAATMRSSGVLSMLGALEWNLNRGQRNLRLFEIGKRYEVRNRKPCESRTLTFGATGLAREKSIHEDSREFGFADLKGDLDRVCEMAGGVGWKFGGPSWLAPGRAARIELTGPGRNGIGVAGQIESRIAEKFKLRQDVFLAELLLEPMLEAVEARRAALRYEPLPRFPAVERDFSLILSDGTTFTEVAETIRGVGLAELRQIEAKDLYRGKNLPARKHSLLVHVTFQSAQGTLTDAQVGDYCSRIVATLEQKLGATLRKS